MSGVRLGISCGDLHGIGLEVTLKALQDNSLEGLEIKVYAPEGALNHYISLLNIEFNAELLDLGVLDRDITPGIPSAESAQWAVRSLERATEDLLLGRIDVLVTAPIDKNAMDGVGFEFPGHTEYLARAAGDRPHLMFLISEKLRMGTITGHIPLADVARSISSELIISKVKVMHSSLQNDFGVLQPRIAVLGLNPHAGDGGRLGSEEGGIIVPAMDMLRGIGIGVEGPFPADGFFGSQQYQQFDAVMSMYHDQGLVPFKALTFGKGVNFTAGLPFVRTSPDHGTAFGIAGKNMADAGSMTSAIISGNQVFTSRKRRLV